MKTISKYIKDFLLLREEDKLHMIPWEMVRSIFTVPTAYKYKGTMLIPPEPRWSWKRKDKAPSGIRARDAHGRYMGDDDSTADINEAYEDGKSPVKQAKQTKF